MKPGCWWGTAVTAQVWVSEPPWRGRAPSRLSLVTLSLGAGADMRDQLTAAGERGSTATIVSVRVWNNNNNSDTDLTIVTMESGGETSGSWAGGGMDEFDSYEVEEEGHYSSQIYSHQSCHCLLATWVWLTESETSWRALHPPSWWDETLPDAPCCSLCIHDVMLMSWIEIPSANIWAPLLSLLLSMLDSKFPSEDALYTSDRTRGQIRSVPPHTFMFTLS